MQTTKTTLRVPLLFFPAFALAGCGGSSNQGEIDSLTSDFAEARKEAEAAKKAAEAAPQAAKEACEAFDVDNGWTVTLKETAMTGGTITEGGVSWTIGGNTEDGGNWNGAFHSEITPHVDTVPEGVVGTFDAQYSSVGRMVGTFGATR